MSKSKHVMRVTRMFAAVNMETGIPRICVPIEQRVPLHDGEYSVLVEVRQKQWVRKHRMTPGAKHP